MCIILPRCQPTAAPISNPTADAMATQPENAPTADSEATRLRIYLLPNLLTAGNLFCGFLALTRIVEADVTVPGFNSVIGQQRRADRERRRLPT